MANETLNGLKVAILVTDGFEQVELVEARKAPEQAGAETRIVSPKSDHVRGWNFTDWGSELPVDDFLDQAKGPDFDAGKPVATICHGSWTIIEAGVAHGRRIASWPSLKTDKCGCGMGG